MASPSVSAPVESAILARDVPSRARQMLAAGDLDGYRRLFAVAEHIGNPHRRYWAAVKLAEQGLAAAVGAPRTRQPALYAALVEGLLDTLDREPREPVLLRHAGTALHELWSLDAAAALFDAAARLDPRLERLGSQRRDLVRRQRLMRANTGLAPLRSVSRRLAQRAQEIAERARPVEGLRLSLCMIVRDEQEMLPRCLASVADAVDELVVVDTGSSDATIEIARGFGARVIEREWTGSFAEARNASFAAAGGDWLMYLDADEVLVREDAPKLRELTRRTWREAFYVSETNHTGALEDGTAVTHDALRIFRNRPEYRFRGRLHEQIADRLPGYLPERIEASGVRVEHYGYLATVRADRGKARRNIELLRLQQEESAPSAFLHYNLGSEHAAGGDHGAALAEFERAWALLCECDDRDSYVFAPALVCRMVKALRANGRAREAIARAQDGLERFAGLTDLVFEQALAAHDLGERDRAIALCERCIAMGDAPSRYTATVGAGTYLPRVLLAELRRERGELPQAVELLERCLREHPDYVGAVLPYAAALLAGGSQPAAVQAAVERHLPEPTPTARFMLGTALHEAGAAGAAEAQFRAVLACQPRSGRARVALGESLLAQRRYAEAASVAAQLEGDDPLAAMASRTELFALIAGGDRERIPAALARARAAAMPAAELDLFSAWQERAAGSGARDGAGIGSGAGPERPHAISLEAVPLLTVMLEALLRVHDFQAFEGLLALLELTPLPQRERRELLAEMYERRGFVQSAAREWMAVCRDEPDERALRGLARIAAGQGMSGDADEFAEAANRLAGAGDPSSFREQRR